MYDSYYLDFVTIITIKVVVSLSFSDTPNGSTFVSREERRPTV